MKDKLGNKRIQFFWFICIGIITLGIGYAAISNIILTINGTGTAAVDPNNFNVHFDTTVSPTITANKGSAIIDINDNKVAHITVNNLVTAKESAIAEYTVINESNGIGTQISLNLVNTNTEYFKVTKTIDDIELQAGETTKVRIVVELLKTPIDHSETAVITGTIVASPIENDNATSNLSSSVVGVPRIPSSYQEIEYIKNSGTQYINTGVLPTDNTKVEANFAITDLTANRNYVVGTYKGASNKVYSRIQFSYSETSFWGWGKQYTTGIQNCNTDKHYLELTKNSFILDDSNVYTPTDHDFSTSAYIYLFCVNNNGVPNTISDGVKIYDLKIYDGTTLVRDFIPCYRKSDSKPGLYDLCGSICSLTGTPFYINAGTGDFITP